MIYDTPIHVYPDNDKRPHLLSKFCPCEPTVEVVNGTPIYTHHAFDHRELFEDLGEWWVNSINQSWHTSRDR